MSEIPRTGGYSMCHGEIVKMLSGDESMLCVIVCNVEVLSGEEIEVGMHITETIQGSVLISRKLVSTITLSSAVDRQLARKISSWWNVDYVDVSSYEEWYTWLVSLRLQANLKAVFEGIFYCLWWSVWMFRNKILFEKDTPSQARIFDNIVSNSYYWCVIEKVKEVLRIKQIVYNLLFEFASDGTLVAVDVSRTTCRYFEKNVVFIIDKNSSILNAAKVLNNKFSNKTRAKMILQHVYPVGYERLLDVLEVTGAKVRVTAVKQNLVLFSSFNEKYAK
ncbi:hypothetical protein Tco_1134509 [Tanacetum coccineum]